ncbi:MAG: hypothetical protein DYH06_18025 [Acidobacteria bacterium ACB2]|nr:hypothetical protein [Acidobacteria bacterium ACB2]
MVIGTADASGKFSGVMPDVREGDMIRMRTRAADGSTSDWLTIQARGVEAKDSRNAIVNLERMDLAAGTAAVTRYRVRGAVKIDYGDGESTWMLHLDDGRVLDVEGDEVAEALAEGRFPSSEVSVARTAVSGTLLSIEAQGEPIEVDLVRAPLTDEEIEASENRPDGREESWDEVVAAAKRHPYVPGPRPEERRPRDDRPGRPPEGPAPPPISNEPIRPR